MCSIIIDNRKKLQIKIRENKVIVGSFSKCAMFNTLNNFCGEMA